MNRVDSLVKEFVLCVGLQESLQPMWDYGHSKDSEASLSGFPATPHLERQRGDTGMSHLEAALGKTQDMLERLGLLADLAMPPDNWGTD